MRNIHAPEMAHSNMGICSRDINPNLRPKCAPQSQSWGMWGKHEQPYIYSCPFHMPRKEIDPKNISSL